MAEKRPLPPPPTHDVTSNLCHPSFLASLPPCCIASDDDEIMPPPSYRQNMDRRRKSVFAESYEPGKESDTIERVSSLLATIVIAKAMYVPVDTEQMTDIFLYIHSGYEQRSTCSPIKVPQLSSLAFSSE